MSGVPQHLYLGWNGCSKNWCTGQCTHFTPHVVSLQSLEWREVGGSSHSWLYLLSLTSVISTSAARTLMLTSTHPPIPLHWTFHLLSIQEAQGNIQMSAQSLLFTHPRGVLPVWCWAGDRQFAPCGAFSVSLFWVCSSRVMGGAPCLLSLHNHTEMSPLSYSNGKMSISVEDLWTSCLMVFMR